MSPDTHILETQLAALAGTRYPLHMPGHKRRVAPAPGLPAAWDFTEVPGADDLHAAEGILADAMARTAALWGAARTFYLINGATCGLLAGIRALAPAGSTVVTSSLRLSTGDLLHKILPALGHEPTFVTLPDAESQA